MQHRGIAKNLLNISFDPDCRFCGLVTSNPFAVRALERATHRKCQPSPVAQQLVDSTRIPYIRNRRVERNSIINTEFRIDHREVLEVLKQEQLNNQWCLGDLPEGYEFIAFVQRW
jgi:hypothetical protein